MPTLDKPNLFIGSSKEGINLAEALAKNLLDSIKCTIWTEAFPLAYNTVDSLLIQLHDNDFAAFVLSPDDIAKIREKDFSIARDNLLYEAGLSTGIYGKKRCFLIIAKDINDFHLPSDLGGLTLGQYNSNEEDVYQAMKSPSIEIKNAINRSIWSTLKIEVTSRLLTNIEGKITFKSKLQFFFTNEEKYPVTIALGRCMLNKLIVDKQDKVYGGKNYFQPTFLINNVDGKDIYERAYEFKCGETKSGWIPLEPSIPKDEIEELLRQEVACKIKYKCTFESDNYATVIVRTLCI